MATDPTGRISHLPEMHRGFSWKLAVRVATTANGTLSTAFANGQTVDGITLATGDRILLKDQSTGSQNGIYVVNASGAPTRAFDMDQDGSTAVPAIEVYGAVIWAVQGTTNAGTLWYCTNTGTITLGSTALTFSQFSGGSISYATPSIVLGSTAAGGAATTVIRSDATIAAFDTTAPSTQALGDSAAVGTAAFAARRDHKHAMPALSSATPIVASGSGATGTALPSSREDHVHPAGAGTGTLTTIEEVDGSPTDSAVTKLVFPNGTLSITSHVATYTPTGGGSGNLTAPSAVSVDLGAANLLVRQAVVNTEDDLFDAASLNAKWLAYTGYDAVTDLTVKPGWCKITTAGAKLQAVPAGDWTLEGEVIAAPTTAAAFTTGGLILTNGTTQSSATEARIAIGQSNGGDNTRVFFEKFVNGAFSTSFTQHTATIGGILPWIMRIVKSGTTYTVQFGNTREGLQFFASNGSIGFTPTHFGFHGDVGTLINGFYRL